MHPTKNTMPDNTRTAMVELLQARLVDTLDLASQSKQAHWNVKGLSFIALHELFDEIYQKVSDYGDMVAERIVTLGGQAKGTSRVTAETSSLDEYPLDASDQAVHVDLLSNALAKYAEHVRTAIGEAEEAGDANTADLFTEISREMEKSLWFVEAHQN